MSLQKVKKLKYEVQNRKKTISTFLENILAYTLYLELLENYYLKKDVYYHGLYIKVIHLSSRQTFQKFIDKCILEKYINTKISKNDKRKIILSLSNEVVSDFENVLWSQLN